MRLALPSGLALHAAWRPPPRLARFGELPPGELRAAAFLLAWLFWLCGPLVGAWRVRDSDAPPLYQQLAAADLYEHLTVQLGWSIAGVAIAATYYRRRRLAVVE